jgi:hypothetical protein
MDEVVYYGVLLVFGVVSGWVSRTFLTGKQAASFGEAIQDLNQDLPHILKDLEDTHRKAAEYFLKIEEVLKERDGWRDLYNDQASGHDNAQALMLSTISQLARMYEKETGKRPNIHPMIECVREDWQMSHGPTARAKRVTDGRPREAEQEPIT